MIVKARIAVFSTSDYYSSPLFHLYLYYSTLTADISTTLIHQGPLFLIYEDKHVSINLLMHKLFIFSRQMSQYFSIFQYNILKDICSQCG